eukprot:gene3272-9999_t
MSKPSIVQRFVKQLVRLTTKVYFSHVEVRGIRNLPRGAAILAGNHPSGLVDPMVLMTALPSLNISTVARGSLFDAPLVSFFLKELKAVPVAQPYDIGVPAELQPSPAERARINNRMFATVEDRLNEGISIVIFPEGTCHSTPAIKDLKVGTAKMALQIAARDAGTGQRFPIVPIGLSYQTISGVGFRSKVLVDIGRPIEIKDEHLDEYQKGGDAAFAVAQKISAKLDAHLRHVTLAVPNWAEELRGYCDRQGWQAPEFS